MQLELSLILGRSEVIKRFVSGSHTDAMDHSDIDRLMAGACSPSDGVCHTTPMGESFPPHAAALTIKVGKGMKKRNREMTCLVPECSADLISRYEQVRPYHPPKLFYSSIPPLQIISRTTLSMPLLTPVSMHTEVPPVY